MAGTKSPLVKEGKVKKRKRDTNDSDVKSKKHRQDDRLNVNGIDALVSRVTHDDSSPQSVNNQPQRSLQYEDITSISNKDDAGWRISKPMGGRMLDIDPVLIEDEHHLIIAYNTSLQVYHATDSLLVRRIPIVVPTTSSPQGSSSTRIAAVRLSRSNRELLWVACCDGHIFCVNWKQSNVPTPAFRTVSGTATALAVIPAAYTASKEVVLVAESDKTSHMEVVAYRPEDGSNKRIVNFERTGQGLQILEASDDAKLIVGAFQNQLFLGSSTSAPEKLEELNYDMITFDVPDIVACMDIRFQHQSAKSKKTSMGSDHAIDIAIGGARGSIYTYRIAVAAFFSSDSTRSTNDKLEVRKYHWHRKAVHAVKWSRDGNYIISGGSENTLVLWQIDTSRKDFLPHLSGSIENIVVSSTGSSYVLHLDDNSTMILSTAELKPTAYIAGIQSAAINVSQSKDQLVRRVGSVADHIRRPIPAAIRPSEPSKLHVCVGNSRQATLSGDFSAPLLQSFDLKSFTSISKQALARTQPTETNHTHRGDTIGEPVVTNIAFSGDGRWFASTDEWQPASRDVNNVSSDMRDQFINERREIYLKFWEVREGADTMALVSRINAPHATKCPESVLDLAADPTSSSFATVGADGVVRLWRPRARQQAGVVLKDAHGNEAVSWSCVLVVAVGDGTGAGAGTDVMDLNNALELQGSVTFSEDGSTLFVAFGPVDSGFVYIVDVASGQVVRTLHGLWDGHLRCIRALSSFIIILSGTLKVYDVVGDELRYGIGIPKPAKVPELMQLAADQVSGHFAVGLPIDAVSHVAVFGPANPIPLLVQKTDHRIVSLVSTPDSSGFVALDDSAQVWVIAEGSDPGSLSTVQPLQDLGLDGKADVSTVPRPDGEVLPIIDIDMASEDDEDGRRNVGLDVAMADNDDDDDGDENDIHVQVVSQQSLTDIFDAAPAFAAPSIEDLFYKVTGLLATKPLANS